MAEPFRLSRFIESESEYLLASIVHRMVQAGCDAYDFTEDRYCHFCDEYFPPHGNSHKDDCVFIEAQAKLSELES